MAQSCKTPNNTCIILLAYSRLGGLEGFALQRAIFLLLLFASEAGKKQQQKNYSRGPAARSPAGELASSIMYEGVGSEAILYKLVTCTTSIPDSSRSFKEVVFHVMEQGVKIGALLTPALRRHLELFAVVCDNWQLTST
jgi:hypothetical protein